MRMNKYILFFSLAFFISCLHAQVPTFEQFYGNITDESGVKLTGNYNVYAFFQENGNVSGSGQAIDGQYGYSDLFFVSGFEGQEGDIVEFYVNGYYSASVSFQEEDDYELNLVYNTSAALICIDMDNDGYGVCPACGTSVGCVYEGNDCNDNDVNTKPGTGEVCDDGADNNCDGSVDEGCGSTDNPGGGGGGGGGGITTPSGTFNLSTSELSVKVAQGESRQIGFSVIDSGLGARTLNVSSNLPFVSGGTFSLPAQGSVDIVLNVNVPLETTPDVYIGKVIVRTGSIVKEISLSVEVVSEDALFDMVMNLPKEYVTSYPGENINADFYLTKLTSRSVNQVTIKYFLMDENENVIAEWSDVKDITETETSYTKDFTLPETMNYGKHLLYSQLVYEGKTASASNWIDIKPRPIDNFRWIAIMLIVFISVLAVLIILLMHRKKEQQEELVNS